MTEEQLRKRHEENLQRLKGFRLMDDDFMTVCLDGQPECVELILQIIMGKPDLKVVDLKVQYFAKNLLKRSVQLDVFATDSKGKKYNIEIQRTDKGAGAKRARYNSSMIDAKVVETRTKFEDLPETYVIFITENDVLGKGRPLYHIERYIVEENEEFGDEAHIIYVNGAYRGDDLLGHLMADFHCTEPSKMYYNKLRNRVAYFKETKEGVAIMCRAMEEMVEKERAEAKIEGKLEERIQIFAKMRNNGLPIEQIAELVGIPEEEIRELLNE